MHLVSYNIQYGKGRDGRYDLARTAAAVAGADVICLQEVECHWDRSGNIDQAETLAGLLGANHWVYGPTVDIHKPATPAGINRRRQFGNMILSRTPILWARRHLLPKQQLYSQFTIQRGVVEATIETDGGPMRVYSTHLCHLSAVTREHQVATILAIHDARHREGPVVTGPHPDPGFMEEPRFEATPDDAVVMGDMNFLPDSEAYAMFAGERSSRHGPLVHQHRFADAWRVANADAEAATFYADFDTKAGARIDHCFVTPGFAKRVAAVSIDSDCAASDHQPLHVVLHP